MTKFVQNRPLKRVIDGKAYNTETATLIHEEDLPDVDANFDTFGPDSEHCVQLYRTRFGKFFLVERNEAFMNLATEEVDFRDSIYPLEQEDAMKWMEKYCNDKIERYLDVEEAGDSSTTLTLRMEKITKVLLGGAAAKEGVSMNAWCVRALQEAVEKVDLTYPPK